MAYIGRSPAFGSLESQTISGNGSTTAFALDFAVSSASSILVFYNDVIQQPTTDYTITGGGSTITFGSAPANGQSGFIIFLGAKLTVASVGSSTFSSDSATGNGSTTGFTIAANRTVDNVLVVVNGAVKTPTADYTISGTTLTFGVAPANSAVISFRYLGQ
mgnify:FL=1|jgi:hypothetical protein